MARTKKTKKEEKAPQSETKEVMITRDAVAKYIVKVCGEIIEFHKKLTENTKGKRRRDVYDRIFEQLGTPTNSDEEVAFRYYDEYYKTLNRQSKLSAEMRVGILRLVGRAINFYLMDMESDKGKGEADD